MTESDKQLLESVEACCLPRDGRIPPGPALDAWDQAERPSDILKLALADLKACARDPRYTVNFNYWHSSRTGITGDNKWCNVCLAGAVMAKRLGAPLDLDLGPAHYDKKTAVRFIALNDFRSGFIWAGLEKLGIQGYDGLKGPGPFRGLPFRLPVRAYENDPDRFFMDMHFIADRLTNAGY